ncbi:cyclase family protein [Microbacterium sp. SA39]|uniref:cyclase family protein n=1 Tax=Microbacterium sp. SA39 TaxID=1263625 RepID=UPI0005F9EE07|nr:cyclase family protein [Microbacterium sp. SA39]KJQ53891.1 Kynurenine formamidase [Microbacterium sp. SA39]
MTQDSEGDGARNRFIDLTIPIAHGMDAFPGEPTARFTPFSTHQDSGIEMWSVDIFSQLGTHVDAPSHFIAGGPTNERLPLESMIGRVAVVDVTAAPGTPLTAAHLADSIQRIRSAGRVILRSGWDTRLGTSAYWEGFAEMTPEAAELLVEAGVRFVGIDTPTPSLTHLHDVHRILLGAGCVLAECLVNTAELSAESFVICLPLPLVGIDGAPARIIAMEPLRD